MTETVEEQLRRVLSASALREVPDCVPVPPRRGVRSSEARPGRMLLWLTPVIAGVAAAVIAVVATLSVVRHANPPASPNPSVTSAPSPAPALVPIPDLTGMTAAQAQSTLASLNLVMKATSEESVDAEKGLVVNQQPESRSSARPGSVVTVVIGTGPIFVMLRAFRVPTDLVGKSYDQALAELESTGLTATRQVVPGTAPADHVIKVAGVKPGASVPAGTRVTLQVSDNQLFVMPSLAGLTVTDAVTRLSTLGWTGTAGSVRVRSASTTNPALVGRIAAHPEKTYDPRISRPNLSSPAQLPGAGRTVPKSGQVTAIVYFMK